MAVGLVAASVSQARSSASSDWSSRKPKADAVGRGRPDQRRAAHLHGRDRPRRVIERPQRHGLEAEGQLGLVDDLDR